MRRHRRDEDGLWSEQSEPAPPAFPTLEPVEREVGPRVLVDEHWRLAFVAFLVYWLPEPVTDVLVKVVSLGLGVVRAIGDGIRWLRDRI